MNHPDWYFKYFDKIFSRKAGYDFEIQQIGKLCSLDNKRIQEIGSGTGEHARRLLTKNIEYLELVDFDPTSIQILRQEFASEPSVNIRFADGFNDGVSDSFDLIILMYSIILLNIEHLQELSHRVDILLKRLNNKGRLIFEVIDRDISASVYREGDSTVLFNKGNEKVSVKSSYSKDKLHFIYYGQLENKSIHYRASLLAVNKNQLFSMLKEKPISEFGSVSLDAFGYRLLVFIKK